MSAGRAFRETTRAKWPAVASGYAVPDHKRSQFLDWIKSKSEFSMAILSGKIEAQMSNPATHYDWSKSEPEYGPERYERASLMSEERQFVKAQIAVVLQTLHPGLRVTRISSFARKAA